MPLEKSRRKPGKSSLSVSPKAALYDQLLSSLKGVDALPSVEEVRAYYKQRGDPVLEPLYCRSESSMGYSTKTAAMARELFSWAEYWRLQLVAWEDDQDIEDAGDRPAVPPLVEDAVRGEWQQCVRGLVRVCNLDGMAAAYLAPSE